MALYVSSDFCLSLPGETERLPFPKFRAARNVLAFYVGEHIFCFFDIERFVACTVRCRPQDIAELKERYEVIGKPFDFSPKSWIGIYFGGDVPDEEIKRLVTDSYNIAKEK